MSEALTLAVVRGAVAGFIAAAAVDAHAFQSWKSFDDAVRYDWRVAGWRWLQGAIAGAATALVGHFGFAF